MEEHHLPTESVSVYLTVDFQNSAANPNREFSILSIQLRSRSLAWLKVLQNSGSQMFVLRFKTLSGKHCNWRVLQRLRRKNHRECSQIKMCMSVYWLAQCQAKWPCGCREVYPAGFKPKHPASLHLDSTTEWQVHINLLKKFELLKLANLNQFFACWIQAHHNSVKLWIFISSSILDCSSKNIEVRQDKPKILTALWLTSIIALDIDIFS